MLLSRQLSNCSLREGHHTLVTLSAWVTTRVTQLWRRFADLAHDTPAPPLPDPPPGSPPASPEPTPRSPQTSPYQLGPPPLATSAAEGLLHGTSPPPPKPPHPPGTSGIRPLLFPSAHHEAPLPGSIPGPAPPLGIPRRRRTMDDP